MHKRPKGEYRAVFGLACRDLEILVSVAIST